MKIVVKFRKGRYVHELPITLTITEDRIEFTTMAFNKTMNAEIKAMKGWRWHGFEEENPRKVWSVANCTRNAFQLDRLQGKNVYAWWEQPLVNVKYDRPLQPQQVDMLQRALTHHYVILAAEQGLGKSLVGIELAERVGGHWWFVGPKSAQMSVKREIKKWESKADFDLLTYEGLVSRMRYDLGNLVVPRGIIFDESTAIKTWHTHRTRESQKIADMVRAEYGTDGFIVLFSGTPTAKHPTDIWAQAEVAWPGFVREGTFKAFEQRYAIMEEGLDMEGIKILKRVGWREHEVEKLPERLKGLMTVYRKADWLDLPSKVFLTERVKPSKKVERVARGLVHVAPNTMAALIWTRALSSGFQYKISQKGHEECAVCGGIGEYAYPKPDICPGCQGTGKKPKYVRETVQFECPKDDLLRKWLDSCDDHGRIVVAAGFQGSIDRILNICRERGWATVCVDGRGWRYYDLMGKQISEKKANPLDIWEEAKHKVAFVGNPGSCRFGLTLTLAHTVVFYDNGFSAEHRLQMIDRIHRIGMDAIHGATIVDFIHLPVDQLVIDTLNENKKLEALSLGVIHEVMGEGEMEIVDTEMLLEPEPDPVVEEGG